MTREMVAICPRTGLHLRQATKVEAAMWLGSQLPTGPTRPARVGAVLVDEWTGAGIWFGSAGF